ncbi:MAG TPA: acetolactate decarboxylase, partial [Methanocella sp.]|nr:acetolactate decarboxylase [Methanocella sp.]
MRPASNIRWYYIAAFALVVIVLALAAAAIRGPPADRDVLYQVSALDLLASGAYDGIAPSGDLKRHGDFGLGTFDGLNGEMIVLDGSIYQVTSDGAVHV